MADESQMKMEALMKAYAEVILNTCNEAAARVMVAERKARCFERQLVSLKEESLSMLLRLKEHFNSMIIEAEDRSLKQQMKIEELEAQLSEAEGITVDLRGELKQVQEQLEIMKHNQKKPLNENILVTAESVQECVSQDYIPNVSDSKSALINYEKKIGSLHPTAPSNIFCHTTDSTNLSSKSHLNQSPFPNGDFTSIIMQNGETNLCRNGCTQRIRALEGKFSNVRLPRVPTSQYEEQLPHRFSCHKDQAIRPLRRATRKNSRYREAIASLQGSRKKFGRTQTRPFRGPLKGCSSGVNAQAVEVPIELADMDPKEIKVGFVSEYDDLSCNSEYAIHAQGENVKVTREASSVKFQNLPNDALIDSVLVDVPISEEFDINNCQLAHVSVSEGFGSSDCQLADVPVSEEFDSSYCQFVDVPVSEGFGSNRSQLAAEDRFLKFKFYRKRRKNVLETTNENVLHNRGPIKRKLEGPADLTVLENCILKDQMHEDTEKMKQVAHQLISLNGAGC